MGLGGGGALVGKKRALQDKKHSHLKFPKTGPVSIFSREMGTIL